MPKPAEYLRGFDLAKGDELAGFMLRSISVKHITITRYQEYEYDITMVWRRTKRNAKSNALLRELDKKTSTSRVIYTRYGNPYQCDFGKDWDYDDDGEEVTIRTTGHCHRVRK